MGEIFDYRAKRCPIVKGVTLALAQIKDKVAKTRASGVPEILAEVEKIFIGQTALHCEGRLDILSNPAPCPSHKR